MGQVVLPSKPAAPKVKICGITNQEDALAAAETGADFIGLVFAPSPRQITLEQALEITGTLSQLTDGPKTVGVFVGERPSKVLEIAAALKLWAVQLHAGGSGGTEGTFPADPAAGLPQPHERSFHVIRPVRIRGGDIMDPVPLDSALKSDPYMLLDAWSPKAAGGTGLPFDWPAAERLKALCGTAKIIIAGGLNAENVGNAIRLASPWAVDVSSGVESGPGKKDHRLMESFVQQVRRSRDGR